MKWIENITEKTKISTRVILEPNGLKSTGEEKGPPNKSGCLLSVERESYILNVHQKEVPSNESGL